MSVFWLMAAALLLAGCHRSGGATPEEKPEVAQTSVPYLDRAQPRLPTIKLWLGDQELKTEVARRQVEIYTGMMYRTNIAEEEAMLFVFPGPDRRGFYMRNTRVALTAAYLAPDGTILELHDLTPFEEAPAWSSSTRIQYVLEVAQGWFQRHNISTGAIVRTSSASFPEMDWRTLRPRGRP